MLLEPTEARTGGGAVVQEAWLGLRRRGYDTGSLALVQWAILLLNT